MKMYGLSLITLFVFLIEHVNFCLCQSVNPTIGDIKDKNTENHYRSVRDIWRTHNHPFLLHKYLDYADAYEKYLPKPILQKSSTGGRTEIKLLEIGVQSGGSLIDWKRYYGDNSVIVGVDIDSRCMRSHMPEQKIFVEIGSQLNVSFLLSVCEKYGPFNVIIDDGGHTAKMMKTSVSTLFPNDRCLLADVGDSVFVIEDLHVTVMRSFFKNIKQFSDEILAEAFRSMHILYDKKASTDQTSLMFQDKLTSIYVQDSFAIFKKGKQTRLEEHKSGNDSFPNDERTLNPKGVYYSYT